MLNEGCRVPEEGRCIKTASGCGSFGVVLLVLSRPTRAAASVIWLKLHFLLATSILAHNRLASKPFSGNQQLRPSPCTKVIRSVAPDMEYFSLKRSNAGERGQANLSSKVYVRSTKSGKVQKIVRELYLRQDIPCSSKLCRACLETAPTDYLKKGKTRKWTARGGC
jgi:hypothetical protein